MGLFNKKKKQETTKATTESISEFDRDIRELLVRDDIQCRPEICEVEFKIGMSLLEGQPTEDKTHRAYDFMGNLASQFDYVPAIMWTGDFAKNVMQNTTQAVFWYKKAADMGNGNGARCYTDMLMTSNGFAKNRSKQCTIMLMLLTKVYRKQHLSLVSF